MPDDILGKVPPQNLDAEQAVLGSMMLETEALHKGVSILSPEDFYRPAHIEIFKAIADMGTRNIRVDLITLQEELRARSQLDDCGGTEYLMALVEAVPTAAGIVRYAEIVAKLSRFRQLISAGHQIIAAAQNEQDDAVTLMMQKAVEIGSVRGRQMRRAPEIMDSVWHRFEGYQEGHGAMGMRFGLDALDKLIYGVRPGELVIIGGRPSQGKSVLLQHLLENAALDNQPVLLFTHEMTAEEVLERVVCMRARIDTNDARANRLTGDEWNRLALAHAELARAPFLVDDMPCALTKLCARARSAAISDGIKMILIDYLQLIECDIKSDNRDGQLGAICWTLKNLAKELNVPVVIPSQLSRSVEKREDKTPMLSDLREGGNQEGHADKVLMLDNPLPKDHVHGEPLKGRVARIVVAKHRGGNLGTAAVWFTPCWTRFDGMAPEDSDV